MYLSVLYFSKQSILYIYLLSIAGVLFLRQGSYFLLILNLTCNKILYHRAPGTLYFISKINKDVMHIMVVWLLSN